VPKGQQAGRDEPEHREQHEGSDREARTETSAQAFLAVVQGAEEFHEGAVEALGRCGANEVACADAAGILRKMNAKRQCSVCGSEVVVDDGSGRAPPRLFFAGREHVFCRGAACLMTFKRQPESFSGAGRAVMPGDGGIVTAPRVERPPSPFTVRAGRVASADDEPG
jgi:hypothetical protein